MTARDDLDGQLDAYLRDGPTELPEPSFYAVRDRTESTRQRVVIGPWRTPDTMNKLVPIGLGAAAVVVALVIGSQLLGPADPSGVGGGPSARPSPTPVLTPDTTPAPPASAGLSQGPFVVTTADDAVPITVDIASPGWYAIQEFDAVSKDDDSKDPPETVGAALLAWSWPAGTAFHVYGDPCAWSTTVPGTPATTPEEIAAAFAAQAASDPTARVDVTVGGYAGKAITLHVPLSYDIPGASREERFGDCDADMLAYYGFATADGTEPQRNAQGAGQIDELTILDVGGSIVILDASYSPATPTSLVDELRMLAASATFE